MTTKIKIQIVQPHPGFVVSKTVQHKQPDGIWQDSASVPDILTPADAAMEEQVYGTQRIIIEEVPEKSS